MLGVLRHIRRGEPHAPIERATGRTRQTIRRSKQRAHTLGWERRG